MLSSQQSNRKRPNKGKKPKQSASKGRSNKTMAAGQQIISVPSSAGVVIRNQTRFSFGQAPYSVFADSTGLRLVFRCLWSNVISNASTVNVMTGSGSSSSSALYTSKLNPYTALAANVPGFAALVTNIAQNFGLWRFRAFDLEYITSSNTSTYAQLLALGYTRSTSELASTPAVSDVAVMQRNVEFPVWSPTPVVLQCIRDPNPSDSEAPLFSVAASEGGMGQYQGAVICAASGLYSTNTYGQLYATAVLDLYCPTNNTGAALAKLDEKKESALPLRREELKAESSDSELVELQSLPMKRAGPLQDHSFTPANTPAGSKSVKSLSLK